MYEGLPERLNNEIVALAPVASEVRVIATDDRKYAVWKGGSVLASLSSFEASCISAKEYQEKGAAVIYRKCR